MSAPPPLPALLSREDLRAAVAAGVLSEAQAARLVALADSRRGAREGLSPDDEPFELFRGFNEVFVVTGLAILVAGWTGLAALWIAGAAVSPGFGGLVGRSLLVAAAGGTLVWALAEYFVRRRRMVFPAIALSAIWGANALWGWTAALSHPVMVAAGDWTSLLAPLGLATASIGLFWLRFRVPFALALGALGLFATALVGAASAAGSPEGIGDLFVLSGQGPFAAVTLVLGLAVFAAAMAFDLSDPHRVTRRSAQAFWLHLVAAPALVNTIALTLLAEGTAAAHALLGLFLALIALVAVVIDRRSFLVAGVAHAVALAGAVFGGGAASFTVLALGAALLALGAGWERLRARLLRALAPLLPLRRLPPAG